MRFNHERGRGCGHHGAHHFARMFGGRGGPGRGGWGGGPFGFGWDGRGDEDGGGRGRRRMFDGGELRLVLLKLIADQPRHGYDLIREVEERSGGAYAPSPGVIYPTLTLLEDMGLVDEQQSAGAKKIFAVTEAGTAHLAERAAEVEALFARLAELGSRQARTSGGPVRRAMGNLKTVLQQRLGQEGVDAEVLHQVAAIIDEAVQKIERL